MSVRSAGQMGKPFVVDICENGFFHGAALVSEEWL